jgi:hypothetical protein
MAKRFVDHDEMTPAQFVQLLVDQATLDRRMGWKNSIPKIIADYKFGNEKVELIEPRVWSIAS